MLIVDSQVHIWAASTPERPWPARHAPHRPLPYTQQDLLNDMQATGVDRAIIVPPSWEGERNDLAIAAFEAHPDKFAIMGRLDMSAADARERIAHWREQPGMLGIRFTFHLPPFEPMLVNGELEWLWSAAEAAGVPLMILIHQKHAPLVDSIAERHPALKIIIDHLAVPPGPKGEAAFADIARLLALAKRPNIAVKASGIPSIATDAYPYRSLHHHLRAVYDAFGAQRVFWGTDLTRLPCTYRQALTLFSEELPWLSAADKEWTMGRGVCEWLGWDVA